MVTKVDKKPQNELTPTGNSTLNPFTKPVAHVKSGEIVEISTWDAYGGIVNLTRTFQEAVEQGLAGALNPVTGPIYIEEAETGDTLAVEILGIDLLEWGGSSIIPGFGALEGWLNLMEPRTKISYIKDGSITYKTDHGKTARAATLTFLGAAGNASSARPAPLSSAHACRHQPYY